MARGLLWWYLTWVRENADAAVSLERFTHMFAMILSDPRNLITKELAWTVIRLHALSNTTIIATGQRPVSFAEKINIVGKTIIELECLLELMLRHYCGHMVAWNVLLVLQSVKCFLKLLVHRQLFIVPWIWASVCERLRTALQQLITLPSHSSQWISDLAKKLIDLVLRRGSPQLPKFESSRLVSTPLVIPRVAGYRMSHNISDNPHTPTDFIEDQSHKGGHLKNSLRCTALDLLALVVDLILVLRPLLLLYCARRVFPHGASAIACMPCLPSSRSGMGRNLNEASTSTDAEESDGLSILRATLRDGPSGSLMSNWSVWLSFFTLDGFLVMLSRYIRRHRVPIVYITGESSNEHQKSGRIVSDGEIPFRAEECSSSAQVMPPLPSPSTPVGTVMAQGPFLSRDSLRMQHALRNMAYSFLHDPFFPAVLQKFLYDYFVVGRINSIPLLGQILKLQVSYFLCKQHYCFMYFLEQ